MKKIILFLFIFSSLFGCSKAIPFYKILVDNQYQYKPKGITSLQGINLPNKEAYSTVWRVNFAQVVSAGKEEIYTTTDCPEEYPEWFLFKEKDCMGSDGEYEIGSLNKGKVIEESSNRLESYIIISSAEEKGKLQIISNISLEPKGAITKMKNEQKRYLKYIVKATDKHQLHIRIESYNKSGKREVFLNGSAVLIEYKKEIGELTLATEVKNDEGNSILTLIRANYVGIVKNELL